MIQEDYVSFELAKKLKEKGFPQEMNNSFQYCYNKANEKILYSPAFLPMKRNIVEFIFCPTLSLVQKWLRKEKGIHVCPVYITYNKKEAYEIEINEETILFEDCPGYCYPVHYKSYEEALAAGINKALEYI